jgi:hypothetical protein
MSRLSNLNDRHMGIQIILFACMHGVMQGVHGCMGSSLRLTFVAFAENYRKAKELSCDLSIDRLRDGA